MPKNLSSPTVRFYLHKVAGRESNRCPINAIMRNANVCYKVATGEGVLASHWNKKKQRVEISKIKEPLDRPEFNRLNDRLDEWVRLLREIWDSYHSQPQRRPLTNAYFNELVRIKRGEAVVKETKTLLQFAGEYVAGMEKDKSRANSMRLAYYALCAYSKTYGEVHFEDVTPKLIPSLYAWLYKKVEIPALKLPSGGVIKYEKKDLEVSSANQIITSIIQFVNEGRRNGLTKNVEVEDIKKDKKPKKIKYSFEVEELIAIYETDFTGHPAKADLEVVRLLTLVGTFCGMRYSDFQKIDRDMVVNDMIEVLTQKTGNPVAIPFFPVFRKILDDANWQIPKFSISAYNRIVKEMCRVSGMESFIMLHNTSGGKKDVSNAQKAGKWKNVSSHYCRRFFIRLMLSLGTPVVRIMAITGHETESQCFHYAGLNNGMDAASVNPEQMKRITHFLEHGSDKVRPMVEVGEKVKQVRKWKRPLMKKEDKKKPGRKPKNVVQVADL